VGTRPNGLLAGIPDPCVVLRPVKGAEGDIVDFEFVDANEAACAYNGTPYDQLIGRTLLALFPLHVPSGLLDTYIEVMRTGVAFADDHLALPPDDALGPFLYFDSFAARVGDRLILRWRDRTLQHQQAARLAESERRYRTLAG
jgi:hypothetical protein